MREKQGQAQGQRAATAQQRAEGIAGKMAFLAQSDLFRGLNATESSELDRITNVIACSPGRILYRPGEQSGTFFLLKSGHVQLYHLSADGRKLITAMLEPGVCFGGIPLAGYNLYQSFAETVEDSLVYVMNKSDVEHLLSHRPEALMALLQTVGQRCAQLETQLVDTAFKGTTARLAALLLQLARPEVQSPRTPTHENAEQVVAGFSQGELADRLGVYRETVALALRELKESGAIGLGRKHITICRPGQLHELSSGQ